MPLFVGWLLYIGKKTLISSIRKVINTIYSLMDICQCFRFWLLLIIRQTIKKVPLLQLSLWTFQVFRAMTQAKVLMSRSWTKKKASSPHEPSGSWFLAIQSMHEGNSGPSPPSSFLTSATHAVSYGEKSRSPPAADLSAALKVLIISSMCPGSPFIYAVKISAVSEICYLCVN